MRKRLVIPATMVVVAFIFSTQRVAARGMDENNGRMIKSLVNIWAEAGDDEQSIALWYEMEADELELRIWPWVEAGMWDRDEMEMVLDKQAEIRLARSEWDSEVRDEAESRAMLQAMRDEAELWVEENDLGMNLSEIK